jgi:hyperosmotically inducible protein
MLRSHVLADVLIAVLLTLPLAGALGARAPREDGRLTLEVKLALATSNVAARALSVDTIDGVVALYGSVPSSAERSEAEQLAKRVEGVRAVRNLLRADAPVQAPLAVSSERIQANVIAALKAEPALADGQIAVPSVTSGVVLLAGRARSLAEAYCAVRIASRVDGVTRVASQIEIPDRASESTSRPTSGEDAPGARRSVAKDLLTTSAVKLRLLANVETAHHAIYVDTDDATVTLFGSVASENVRAQAAQLARSVTGVRQLVNDLVVSGPRERRST